MESVESTETPVTSSRLVCGSTRGVCGGGEAGGCGGGGGCGGVSSDNRLKVTLAGNRNNAVSPAEVGYSVSSWWLYHLPFK